MDIKFIIGRLFTHNMGNTNWSTSVTTSVDTIIGSQHTVLKKKIDREGGITGMLEVSLMWGYLMEIDA